MTSISIRKFINSTNYTSNFTNCEFVNGLLVDLLSFFGQFRPPLSMQFFGFISKVKLVFKTNPTCQGK